MLVKMEVYHDGEQWCARGLGADIFTQGKTMDKVVQNIREAVALHFDEVAEPIDVLVLQELKVPCHAQTAPG